MYLHSYLGGRLAQKISRRFKADSVVAGSMVWVGRVVAAVVVAMAVTVAVRGWAKEGTDRMYHSN